MIETAADRGGQRISMETLRLSSRLPTYQYHQTWGSTEPKRTRSGLT